MTIKLKDTCIYCGQSFEGLAIMAMLADLGVKGSCENSNNCYASPNHEHSFKDE